MSNNKQIPTVLTDLKDLVNGVKKLENEANEFLKTLSVLNDMYGQANELYNEINRKYTDAKELNGIIKKIENASEKLSLIEKQIESKNVIMQQSLQKVTEIAQSQQNAVNNIAEIAKAQKTIDHKLTSVSETLSEPTAVSAQLDSIDIRSFIEEQKEDLYRSLKKEMQKEIDDVIKNTSSNFEKRITALVKYLDKVHNQTDNIETEKFDIISRGANNVVNIDDIEIADHVFMTDNEGESNNGTKPKSKKNKKEKKYTEIAELPAKPLPGRNSASEYEDIVSAALSHAERVTEHEDKKAYLKAKYENIFSVDKVRKERDWIWIYDEGENYTESLKNDGFEWSSKRQAWYYNGR